MIQLRFILYDRNISRCLTIPVLNTMAFGGVPTGIIKAQEAPKPIINAKPSGDILSDSAMEIKIGTNNAALAVFEVNSVSNTIKEAIIKQIM